MIPEIKIPNDCKFDIYTFDYVHNRFIYNFTCTNYSHAVRSVRSCLKKSPWLDTIYIVVFTHDGFLRNIQVYDREDVFLYENK